MVYYGLTPIGSPIGLCYKAVDTFIRQGYDAFVINRRTIADKYTSIDQVPLMYTEIGEPHNGYDCFVFRRDVYPKFRLETVYIGTAWIGGALLANMVAHAARYREFGNEHLTFHIGDPGTWRNDRLSDYLQDNRGQYLTVLHQLEMECGQFEPIVRSYSFG